MPRTLLVLLTFVSLLFLQSSRAAAADYSQIPDAWLGVWVGEAIQDNSSLWPLRATFGKTEVKVDYPLFPCGGSLELKSVHRGDSVISAVFTERLEYGKDKCLDGGQVTISQRADTFSLIYKWEGYYSGGKLGFALSKLRLEQRL